LHKTVQDILSMKKEKKKISVITSYDYTLSLRFFLLSKSKTIF